MKVGWVVVVVVMGVGWVVVVMMGVGWMATTMVEAWL